VSRPNLRQASKKKPSPLARAAKPKPKAAKLAKARVASAPRAKKAAAKLSRPAAKAVKAKLPAKARSQSAARGTVAKATRSTNGSKAPQAKAAAAGKTKAQASAGTNGKPASARVWRDGFSKGSARRNDSLPVSVDPAIVAYESEVLSVLTAEAAGDPPAEANTKIQRRLRDKKLGAFDASRIEVLRAFKSALVDEIHLGEKSSYFTGSHGLYASPEDFDHARLAQDLCERFPSISRQAVAAFIPIAVYYYYLR
jgi:hypothetical protein